MTGSSQKSWKGALLLATTVIGCFLTTSVHAGELPTARVTQRAHLPGETVELSLENATPGQIVWLYVAGVPGAFDNGVGVFLGLVPASGSLTLSANLGCDVPDLFVQYGVISIDGLTLTNEVSVLLVDDSSCGPAGQGCSVEQWAGSAEWPVPYSPTQLYAEASFVDLFPGMTMREVLETTNTDDLSTFGAESVAALLNAASNAVNYELIAVEIRVLIRDVFNAERDPGVLRDEVFGFFNSQGCPPGIDSD